MTKHKRSTYYAGNRRSFSAVAATADWMRVGYNCDMRCILSSGRAPCFVCADRQHHVCAFMRHRWSGFVATAGVPTRVKSALRSSCSARLPGTLLVVSTAKRKDGGWCHHYLGNEVTISQQGYRPATRASRRQHCQWLHHRYGSWNTCETPRQVPALDARGSASIRPMVAEYLCTLE